MIGRATSATILTLILAVTIAGCTVPGAPGAATPSLVTAPAPSKPGWQEDWEKSLRIARSEGRVVVYSSGTNPAMRDALTRVYKDKFNLDLEFLVANAPEISARLSKEHAAGLYIADVIIGGPDSILTVDKPMGFVEPIGDILVLPEVLDPKVWWNNRLNYMDKERYALAMMLGPWTIVLINSDMVRAEELLSWNSLLEPRWKSKMIMFDPTGPGGGSEFFMSVAGLVTGVDYMRELARKQDLFVTRDRRLQVEWVARGKYPIALGASTTTAVTFFEAGAPIAWWFPKEKPILSPIGQCLALPIKSPHPNARKVFVNSLLTKEIQTIASKAMNYQSARNDVPTDHLAPYQVRKEGVEYLIRTEELILRGAEFRKLSGEIFGPYIK